MNEQTLDVLKPVGGWKQENNSTNVTIADKQQIIEFSDHSEVPELMTRWLALLHAEVQTRKEPKDVLRAYARLHVSLTTIHPFWDGNGRIARLVSNLPCLKAGYPPIIIEKERRYEYITALAAYTLAHGIPSRRAAIVHENASLDKFYSFCEQSRAKSQALVQQAHALQQKRDKKAGKGFSP